MVDCQSTMQDNNTAPRESEEHAPTLVLQVEDNDVDALLAQAAVAKALGREAQVLRATTLARGLAIVRAASVDLVLLDLNLPDSHGLETLKRMRASTDSPIIVVTVEDAPDLDQQALAAGAFEILHKGRLGPDAIVRLLRLAEQRRATRKSSEQAVQLAHSRLELALAASGVCTWDYDLSSGEVVLSDSWSVIVGARTGVTRTSFAALANCVHPEDVNALSRVLAEVMKGQRGEYSVEHRVRHVDGDWRWIVSRGKVVARDTFGRALRMLGTNLDISERKRAEARLLQLAHFDTVTGLPNRVLLEERLAFQITRAHRHARGVGVLFVDVDHFKLINDTYGHKTGDELLAAIGRRLTACVGDDDSVARLSGDQFAIVVADLSRTEDVTLVAQKILDSFEAPFDLRGREAFIGTSIGMAAFPRDGDSAAALLTCAETAMRRVKSSSRNAFCFFSPDMNARAATRLHLHTDLRHAVDRNEFRLHYQPKVELSSGAIIGVEALLRWEHPLRGMISPAEFIPALEDTGLILPVGDWVIEEALSQLRLWLDQGLVPVPIAVNLSAKQFRRRNLDQLIHRQLAEHGVAPQLLELEITESCLMDDPQDAVRQLQALREAGFTISVDDFGTGYSSLAYLTRLPISTLKVDQSFVNAALGEPASAAIVRMVIDMSRTLGLNVVAEGIETDAHVAFLRLHGCEQGQGFLFGKPMPSAEISARLSRRA